MTPGSLARSLLAVTVVGVDTVAFAPPAIAGSILLGPTHRFVNRLYRGWARVLLLGCSARLRTTGDDHLDPERSYVFVSNHLSDLDTPAIICSLQHHAVRFVAKQELARLPLFGRALRATGNVVVTRSNTTRDVSALEDAQRSLLGKVSVLFFAEGTRSSDGTLGRFKRGAAAFALRARMPLVPVGVRGSFEILPRGLEIKRAGTIGVAVGDPIPVDAQDFDNRQALTEVLREAVAHQIERAHQLL